MGTYCCDMGRNPDACSRIIAIHRSTHTPPRHSTHIHPRHPRRYWNLLKRAGIRGPLPSLSLSIPAPCPFFVLISLELNSCLEEGSIAFLAETQGDLPPSVDPPLATMLPAYNHNNTIDRQQRRETPSQPGSTINKSSNSSSRRGGWR